MIQLKPSLLQILLVMLEIKMIRTRQTLRLMEETMEVKRFLRMGKITFLLKNKTIAKTS